ncbi:hypothetical protein Taro_026726 [Colocasia esculenta]|uniref:Uncharacterized protein n=1 Tax=Colocasia esculenta TaxID=4460 RepID=A0A843VCN2_COLES|nr:hypothetical protein [Colocasia esculenta]
MDAYLYRSRSVKQPGIKQALKGVKATAKAAKGAIKGVPAHTAESPFFQSMLDVERYKMKVEIYRGYDMTYAAQRLTPGGFTCLDVCLKS